MVKRIRMAAGVICLTAYLCGCSPGHENGNVAPTDGNVAPTDGNVAPMDGNVAPADGKMASSDAGYQSRGQAPASLEERDVQRVTQTASPENKGFALNPSGSVLSERIPAPSGYERTEAVEGSFQDYIRSYPLKPDKSPVTLYDGSEKGNQTAHAAVFALPVFDSDLQQCADSVIRMYGEYLWARGASDRIAFHLTNGFLMDYPSWREGNRLAVDGNQVWWVKRASYDDSYETFLLYMKYVMMYAGTLSLDNECTAIDISRIKAGDMFIKGGSPGHCVMVADVAVNRDGDICFLLAQGYMPAQDFHILNNPLHMEDPWYYARGLSYPLKTPEYVFQEGSLKRWYLSDFL